MKFLKLKKLKLTRFNIFLILMISLILLVNGTNLLCNVLGLGKKCNKVKLNMNSFSDQAIVENMENIEDDIASMYKPKKNKKGKKSKESEVNNDESFSNEPSTKSEKDYDDAYNQSNSLSNLVYTQNGEEILATPENTVMGIPKNKIPPGQEDLYILKSEVVPPVCPACPPVIVDKNLVKEKHCPPCPPCERCPEPSFTCKKVPNYESDRTNETLPKAFLNDFSQFGM